MKELSNLAISSNEKREQRIMLLRAKYNDEKYNTIEDVVNDTGYTDKTVRKWAIDGNIPLIDTNNQTIVPITFENKRVINMHKRQEHINQLRKLFYSKQAITSKSCAKKMRYPEKTIIKWAFLDKIPLLLPNGKPVVPLTEENKPDWI
ncbi:hypothetical protein [Ligilactobacillus salivarius]|uniref:hypothetical protein n=1 Tax=Ligilactobacillus salivarius TaxID=1624 RepID=UPI000B97AFCC|nr:hypothetical protein [Ligilactobacillus salivarius]OYP91319.1 hypothetical protein B9G67_05185 [Ligilactobacillus salivarius]